jgi:ubiquinone/menaquinone biosynthesis C-methylase UbiE
MNTEIEGRGQVILEYLKKLNENPCVLDAGCGTCSWSFAVSNYVGCDINPPITSGCNRYAKPIIVGDILNLPFLNEVFDVVVCTDVIEHLKAGQEEKAIEECHRVLKGGGEFHI